MYRKAWDQNGEEKYSSTHTHKDSCPNFRDDKAHMTAGRTHRTTLPLHLSLPLSPLPCLPTMHVFNSSCFLPSPLAPHA